MGLFWYLDFMRNNGCWSLRGFSNQVGLSSLETLILYTMCVHAISLNFLIWICGVVSWEVYGFLNVKGTLSAPKHDLLLAIFVVSEGTNGSIEGLGQLGKVQSYNDWSLLWTFFTCNMYNLFDFVNFVYISLIWLHTVD